MNQPEFRPAPIIAFIGGGNMARSLIGGLIQRGHDRSRIRVAEPVADLRRALIADFGVMASDHNQTIVAGADLVVLAVKPQVMGTVCAALAPALTGQALIVSIAAGIALEHFRRWFGADARLVRAMPNTPALIGAGVTGLYADALVDASARDQVTQLLSAAGPVVWMQEEAQIDAVTAVSGSGPAYFFLLMESLIAAGIEQGLDAAAARQLVLHTALGAARMAIEGSEDPAELRRRVTSPNGTTQAAVETFEAGGFRALASAAVRRATERGRELSAQFGS